MAETTGRPPVGMTVNPKAIAEARRRGWPQTAECHADAATLLGVDLHIPATNAAIDAGLHELAQAERQKANRASDARDLGAMGLKLGQG
jgi:hypothetical protein